jgi:bisphosphoglycerate-independent phosphoglycerate mutase (AlkP superfamily)
MTESAGVPLRDLHHKSLFMDFTNRFLRDRGFEVPVRSPETAAEILVELAAQHDLCLYEYFLTDLEGHRGTLDSATELLHQLDCFLFSIVKSLDLDQASLVVSSDHGNIEDMSHGQHTRNPVPTMLWGQIQEVFHPFESGLRLQEVTPLIIQYFEQNQSTTCTSESPRT